MRALRLLAPARLADARHHGSNARMRRVAFLIALVAVILEFAVSGNSLNALGIDYSSPGGNPLVKLHPATYLVALAAFMVLLLARPAGSGLIRFFHDTPALASFILLILFCAFFSIVNVGFSGAAIYVESYLAAGLLAVVLETATDRQKRTLAWWIIGFCVLSNIIAIGETATQTHLIDLHLGDETLATAADIAEESQDFRAAGLFGHSLTAGLVTSMAMFLLLQMRMNGMLKAAIFTIFLIGFLSFGGRVALLVTLSLLLLSAAVVLLRGILMRNLRIGFVGIIAAAVVILPPVLFLVINGTDIGERIVTHMYLDESAMVRGQQWMVLDYLNLHDALFGVSVDRLAIIKYQIGLGDAATDIENFWLLMFLNLGVIGFSVFVVALGLLFMHLGRTTARPLGWVLLLSAMVIDSSSNSLGRKSVDLFFMAACMIAMTGYPRSVASLSIHRQALTSLRRTSERLGIRPVRTNLAGLRS